jgi:hypothetical protein
MWPVFLATIFCFSLSFEKYFLNQCVHYFFCVKAKKFCHKLCKNQKYKKQTLNSLKHKQTYNLYLQFHIYVVYKIIYTIY